MPTTSSSLGSTKKVRKRRPSGARRQVAVTYEAHGQLMTAADKLGMTATEYASAAITYFADSGINPVTEREREGMAIQGKIHDLEKVVTTLGNRIFGWLTQHEKNTFGYLRGHEKTLFEYLQKQEQNVHEHLGDQEELFLAPLIREVMMTNLDARDGRNLALQAYMKLLGRDVEKEFLAKAHQHDLRRDGWLKERFNAFLAQLTPPLLPNSLLPPPTPIPDRSRSAFSEQPVPATTPSTSRSEDALPDTF